MVHAGLFDWISVMRFCNVLNRLPERASIKWQRRITDMTPEMRRHDRYTHMWKTITKGAGDNHKC